MAIKETVRWFRETLGLVCADDVYAGDKEKIIGQFSRIDAGDDYVDHHAFFPIRNERNLPGAFATTYRRVQQYTHCIHMSQFMIDYQMKRERSVLPNTWAIVAIDQNGDERFVCGYFSQDHAAMLIRSPRGYDGRREGSRVTQSCARLGWLGQRIAIQAECTELMDRCR
jgi:hypothetical protein